MIERPRPWIVGHRGVAAEAVENTLASFELAVSQGADMIELDVQLAGDGRLVAFHDSDLIRLADRPEVVEETGTARLGELLPELVTLEEILSALPEGMPLNVELKRRRAATDDFIEALARTLGARPRILLSSFDWELLRAAAEGLPDRPRAPLAEADTAIERLLGVATELDAWSIHCDRELAGRELLARARRPVLVYTVNDAAEARALFDRGVAGVFTDAPGRLRAALDPRSRS